MLPNGIIIHLFNAKTLWWIEYCHLSIHVHPEPVNAIILGNM